MRFLAALLLLVGGSTAAAETPPPSPPLTVEVTKRGDAWTADFRFRDRNPVWLFARSAVTREDQQPWRPRSWTVETPGVRLERRGYWDVLIAEGRRMPPRVRVRFTPFTQDLLGDYDPALVFTDGSVALHSGQFHALPISSPQLAGRLPADLARSGLPQSATRLTFSDEAEAVLHGGLRVPAATVEAGDGDGTYVLFGPAEPVASEAMTAIVDPALPGWIRSTLERSIPGIFARYAEALGPADGPRPTVMVSWAGPTRGVTSMGGSALPGLITMAYEGEGVVAETPGSRGFGLWFIAHEAAHFWLGHTVTYEYARDSWITEGGADLLAFRTVAMMDRDYDWRGALDLAIRDCARLAQGRGVASAEDRNEQRAYYACGAVFGLVAEASAGGSFTAFVRALIDDNRGDGIVSRRDWLAALDRASGDPSLSADIGRLLDTGAEDPASLIASLLARAGVAHAVGDDGLPRLR
ncbi:hypothetical protein [Sphingosinicella terrae]|uniref:hypothetical protein n=1 Tax=Sphingosinicella terrae TaxID=2172047 RepID=UPI002548488C|nr:hypothetical protein [Sphingosinicella terrae]